MSQFWEMVVRELIDSAIYILRVDEVVLINKEATKALTDRC